MPSREAAALHPGSAISGALGLTTLKFIGAGRFITAKAAAGLKLANFTVDGGMRPLDPAKATALLSFDTCPDLDLNGVRVTNSSNNAIALT